LIEAGADHQELRPALFRRYRLSDEEIAIALLEDVEAATAHVRRQVAAAHAAAGGDASRAARHCRDAPEAALRRLLAEFEARLAGVAEELARPKWPGPRICVEELIPAVVAGDRPVEIEVVGWLFDDRSLDGEPYLIVELIGADGAPR